MVDITKLIKGYADFYTKYYNANTSIFKNLQNKQSPQTLIISCSDSRVDPAILMNVDPGDIFVVRNVANLVPPYEEKWDSKHGTSAALEFAVNVLQVKNIIILGHSNCGGIKAFANSISNPTANKDLKFVSGWMNILDPMKAKIPSTVSNADLPCYCEKEAIKQSLSNLITFPFIKSKLQTGQLSLYGWYFDITSGSLLSVEKNGEFSSIDKPIITTTQPTQNK